MRKLIGAAVAAFALSLPFTGPASADDKVSSFALDNGMQVVVIEDHRAPVVVHMVWYRAGSADETPGVSGVAHFLEHLMFKATENMEAGHLSKVVAQNGGSDNAFTSFDYTAYFQRVAADRLPLMMQMEADRMVNLKLTPEDIATERDVIIEERNVRVENSPAALFREQKRAAQYLNHRYGIPIIGWRHEMEHLDRKAALDFYKQFYAPNNAILVVAGDVQPDAVHELAKEIYGKLPANPDLKPRARPSEPRQMAERRMIFRDPRVTQPYVSRSYMAPERNPGDQKDAAALTLLASLLGGSPTAYLNQKLQYDSQTAVYTSAFYDGQNLDETTFSLIIVPSEGVSLSDAEEAMDATVAQFMKDGIDSEELARIKTQLKAAEIYARDDVGDLAERYGSALAQGLTIEDVQSWPEVLQSVTEDEIMAAARDVLNRDRAVTGYLMIDEKAPTHETSDAPEVTPASQPASQKVTQ
ncbi:M16 family metallopeptidase [Rhodalgimonas zhirmunskyi]|uniref:Insulinase family protein n=1 Tax=Rhodalgimonas zhirmunskyi TaxID=2964767 RepID=A0AAJ1UE66_9RHOB|nr:pitrilysin family protein [Rhodoalgimonas zhirmunskyi]MDQ2094377.1 insulinase family protein [Rhodoalgimonas zhirmunskyi]